jgi:DNA modification methylase
MCVTSPPYWGLRDYGVDGQIGLEATPGDYASAMCAVFEEVRRVLKDDGVLWLNLGDTYITNPRGPNCAARSGLTGTPDSERRRERFLAHPENKTTDPKVKGRSHAAASGRGARVDHLKHKDMVGIPWMVAFVLRHAGWYLRADIIWHKPNPMPESIEDRPTKSHEYLFLFAKSESYYYDSDAIAEQSQSQSPSGNGFKRPERLSRQGRGSDEPWTDVGGTRNKRSVWTVATVPYDEAHFATFPPKLIEPCILAGSRPGDIVLDPFFGSGTTGQVAERNGRRWLGFDLNPAYKKLQDERTAQRGLTFMTKEG